MIKYLFSLSLLLAVSTTCFSQVIFTYGSNAVDKGEFLKAFNKNPSTEPDPRKAMKEYLDLYIKFKLKVQAAKDAGLQNDDNFKLEGENFKRQLTENLVNEQANINQLVLEAFERSQQDLLISQIFIEVPLNSDTASAYANIQKAYAALKAGKDFVETAGAYSTDPAIQQNNGEIGYITVFSLPYKMETVVYGLKPGQFSAPYKSAIGYHIFKVNDARPAAGKRTIRQILLPLAAGATEAEKAQVAHKADSLYQLAQQGVAFEQLAMQNNLDAATNNNGMTEVGTGQYSPGFEQQVFSLKATGDISKPFTTSYGYHIIKLLDIIPVGKDSADVMTKAALQEKIIQDGRLNIAKEKLLDKWMTATGYKPAAYNEKAFLAYTDSLVNNRPVTKVAGITAATALFSFAKQTVTLTDWADFVQASRTSNSLLLGKNYKEALNQFTRSSCSQYYRNHIEDYNPSVKEQLAEFNDANLLFAIMDKQVWSNASADSAGLHKYYQAHAASYTWQPGVSALFVTAANKEQADEVAAKIKANPANWKAITESYGTQVYADSSRYEKEQLPGHQSLRLEKGFAGTPEKNEQDNSWSFIYITEVHPNSAPRSFDDARGLVINDYQQVVEEKWVETLRKKYPVKINEAAVASLK
ncbi:peptidylprolyl isomerase [Foetidibacter luteolus]|uniref:peptidylprolyl isomerase n=1 Tax=Foetidibacter luteolus TaxID=2608880 RepID=UPI00129A5E0F|nr:peptidylprolyl isomerase [Foetidibacter luteolus]